MFRWRRRRRDSLPHVLNLHGRRIRIRVRVRVLNRRGSLDPAHDLFGAALHRRLVLLLLLLLLMRVVEMRVVVGLDWLLL